MNHRVLLPPPPRAAERTARDVRRTPPEVYEQLDAEFLFTLDPCPLDEQPTAGAPLWGNDGLSRSWSGERVFCNPPYSNIPPWLRKWREAELAVFLLPVRADLGWWHDDVMHATEVRFIRGRLRFQGRTGAPFASVVVIFDPRAYTSFTRYTSWLRPPRPERGKGGA